MEVAFASCTDQEVNSFSDLVSTLTVSTLAWFDLVVDIAVVIWLLVVLWDIWFFCRYSFASALLTSPLYSFFDHFVNFPSCHAGAIDLCLVELLLAFATCEWFCFIGKSFLAFAAFSGGRSCHIIVRSLCMCALSVLGSCCASHT